MSAPIILPKQGVARVKSVLSGDTAVLMGKPLQPGQPAPEVLFTLEQLSAPRLASKSTPVDEPGAFAAREWLRSQIVGKSVRFETRKQGASAGDRIYGWLLLDDKNLGVECVRHGHATPKAILKASSVVTEPTKEAVEDPVDAEQDNYEQQLLQAYQEARSAGRGIHSTDPVPAVRNIKTAGDDFAVLSLVQACQKLATNKRITCVIEYVFDGSRLRCHVTDPSLPAFQYANFTMLVAGITCPRVGNPTADPPVPKEEFSDEARVFTETRLLQRELQISLLGTDRSGSVAVGTVHHPAGNIAMELLKNGLARLTDWSVRLMPSGEVPPLRVAENNAKRTATGIWHAYAPPVLTTASELRGMVVEVQSGDTVLILPDGKTYDSEETLQKISLASIRAPRLGSAVSGREDEPFAEECKERLRILTIGKSVVVNIHYERDIPVQPGVTEKRAFGTVAVPKHPDVAEVLVAEGLAVTQRHRDDDETSPRYDELRAAEATAKAAKKGVHNEGKPGSKGGASVINDLTDPRKAKAYSGALIRAGNIKATVAFVFHGALFKLHVPAENCYIRFAPNYVRCPQPSASPGSKQQAKPAEPFGDEAKRHAKLNLMQRTVEISCSSVTNSGIVVGNLFLGAGKDRRDYSIELLGAGFATLDQRKVEYGEVPKHLMDAQTAAQGNKVGLWSLAQPETAPSAQAKTVAKLNVKAIQIKVSEIRNGSHFFYHEAFDNAVNVVEESMKLFTKNNGTAGAPCDAKVGKVVAALFDDGTGKAWYRAKIVEKVNPVKVSVLYIDHGNVATVPISTHLRPLDVALGTDRIPPVAKEATLALTKTQPLNTDAGVDAARLFQSLCWGKVLSARTFAADETGKMAVAIDNDAGPEETVNAQLVMDGLARAAKKAAVDSLSSRMADDSLLLKLAAELSVAEEAARKSRSGIWRYGDIGDDEDEDGFY